VLASQRKGRISFLYNGSELSDIIFKAFKLAFKNKDTSTMKAKDLRWVLVGYFALLFIALTIHSDEMVGISATSENGQALFQVGSSLWSIVFAMVNLGLWFALLASSSAKPSPVLPTLFRRWLAGLIDFVMGLLLFAPFIGFCGILLEWKKTGIFEWIVERPQPTSSDWWLTASSVLLMMFVLIPLYAALLWRKEKPTPGGCICGFHVVADEGHNLTVWQAWLRALLGAISVLCWPFWIVAFLFNRNSKAGKFWLDAIFHTHAEVLG
jgi:uncharacterized RDD family membrane protein YckC